MWEPTCKSRQEEETSESKDWWYLGFLVIAWSGFKHPFSGGVALIFLGHLLQRPMVISPAVDLSSLFSAIFHSSLSLHAGFGEGKPSWLGSCTVSPGGAHPGILRFWVWPGLLAAMTIWWDASHHLGERGASCRVFIAQYIPTLLFVLP